MFGRRRTGLDIAAVQSPLVGVHEEASLQGYQEIGAVDPGVNVVVADEVCDPVYKARVLVSPEY